MASLQTILTAHKTAAQPVTIDTQSGTSYVNVIVTDDGTVGDSIVVQDKGGNSQLIVKSAIVGVPTTPLVPGP